MLNLPLERTEEADRQLLVDFASWWLANGGLSQKAAALRLFQHLLTAMAPTSAQRAAMAKAVAAADCQSSTPLLFLQLRLGKQLGLELPEQTGRLDREEAISNVFLDNLKPPPPGF